MFDYKGKNVVVVGGTSGINLAIALAFAQAGANVAVASRSAKKVNAAVKLLREANPKGTHMGASFDVRDVDGLTAGFSQFNVHFAQIDVNAY